MKFLIRIFTGIILSIVLFEIYFTATEICLPRKGMKSPNGIPEFIPNRDIFLIKEGFCMSRTNEKGFLGDPVDTNNSEDQLRIAFIGDSYVEGFQVFPKYHFSSLLKSKLIADNPKLNVKIINLGISGLNFGDMLEKYLKAIQYRPDYIFVFVEDNDFHKLDSVRIDRIISNSNQYFDYSNFSPSFFKELSLYTLIGNAHSIIKSNPKYMISLFFDKFSNYFLNKEKIKKKKAAEYEISTIDKILSEMKKQTASKIYFVEIQELDEALRNSIQSQNFEILSLADVYRKVSEKGVDPFYWKSIKARAHWNHSGHREIGLFIARLITAMEHEKGLN